MAAPGVPLTGGIIITRIAAADYSAKRYFIVVATASNKVTVSGAGTTKTNLAIGVIQDVGAAAGAGDSLQICILGPCWVSAGGTITAGQIIASDASGEAVRCDADATIGFGYALESAVDGDIFPMVVTGPNAQGVDLI